MKKVAVKAHVRKIGGKRPSGRRMGRLRRLVHMKKSKKESKADNMPSSIHEPYGYGLRINLDHEGMKKLGIKDMPTAGSKITLHAHGHVSSSEQTDTGDGPRRNMSVQITHLAMDKGGDMDNESLEGASDDVAEEQTETSELTKYRKLKRK